jgi:hypothetical protein
MILKEKKERKQKNLQNIYLFIPGVKIRAISKEDDCWHEGEVKKVEGSLVLIHFYGDN